MCGIFALLNNKNNFSTSFIEKNFYKGADRGPESSSIRNINDKVII